MGIHDASWVAHFVIHKPTQLKIAPPSMAPKGSKRKAESTAKKDDVCKRMQQHQIASMACGFRNVVKYRASERCKKALIVRGP